MTEENTIKDMETSTEVFLKDCEKNQVSYRVTVYDNGMVQIEDKSQNEFINKVYQKDSFKKTISDFIKPCFTELDDNEIMNEVIERKFSKICLGGIEDDKGIVWTFCKPKNGFTKEEKAAQLKRLRSYPNWKPNHIIILDEDDVPEGVKVDWQEY